MKELILENIGIIFYLIGCLIVIVLIISNKDRRKFDLFAILIILMSWITVVGIIITAKDKHYKSIK